MKKSTITYQTKDNKQETARFNYSVIGNFAVLHFINYSTWSWEIVKR